MAHSKAVVMDTIEIKAMSLYNFTGKCVGPKNSAKIEKIPRKLG